ncbi:MAG: GNAT family N-acetyltransferase [Pseudomonadota bacterium]|nr:GNAT family N-acetyltransferase [Pseudomonadota bacterium]
MFRIEPMDAAAEAAYPEILDICFGPDRKKKISYRFRDGVEPSRQFALAAYDGERMIGAIQYWPCMVQGCRAELLGPVAVLPAYRGRGAARALVTQSLVLCRKAGIDIVVLVGDPALYRQYGFLPASAQSMYIPDENPARTQIKPFTVRGGRARGAVLPVEPMRGAA